MGSGIESGRDLSRVAIHHIKSAQKVFSMVGDPVTVRWLCELNKSTELLDKFYSARKPRLKTYEQMTDRIVSFVKRGEDVCVVTYGHPAVSVYATHKAIERVRAMGASATMLPAVSALDCLIADLGIDPVAGGLAVYDATDFLFFRRSFDAASRLVLLQIAVTAEAGFKPSGAYRRDGLRALVAKLMRTYGRRHEVIIYQAAQFPITKPKIVRLPLADVPDAPVVVASTLYVPPKNNAPMDMANIRRFRRM
ncbi:MAG: hypothetical protein JOY86_00685 [Candidatus Eremiobacteraeota bacterium]|nr:hypothetical protein [Candidatus Eremiobacteraeota bacterium]